MVDRPLECTECKRPIAVFYTEVEKDTENRNCMCAECPVLQRFLNGPPPSMSSLPNDEAISGLCCGRCGTTLESIRTGNPLGCCECYDVFADVLIQEMVSSNKLPQRLLNNLKKTSALYIGNLPGESKEFNPSAQILALNEALTETLSREDYEQAAQLRDQIKALMDKPDDTK